MIDFSGIMAGIKPSEQTRQCKVLAALYQLNARVVPVTVEEINRILILHYGERKKINVADTLQKSRTFIAPKEKGPPRKWALTDKGIERLEKMSGLKLVSAPDHELFRADIGIICALTHPELHAVFAATGGACSWKQVGDQRFSHVYLEGLAKRDNAPSLRLIATTSSTMGLTAAAIATTHLIYRFRPRVIAMIGIAAGTHDGDKRYGDVLVADPSVDYNSGKVVMKNGVRGFQPDPYPIGLNFKLRSRLQKYQGVNPIFEEIRKKWRKTLPSGPNRLHLGALGAGDQVIDDPTRILEIQDKWRKLIGVEMETYGVYRAVEESSEPKPKAVSFKSVCDFAAEKSDSWQEFAAFMAAEFAIQFLVREWDTLWPTPTE